MSLSSLGLLGRKVGMMRLFTDDGDTVPVTVVDVSNNRVTQVKTEANDGYSALQVAFGARKASRVTKPAAGHLAKAGVEAGEILKEFRVTADVAGKYAAGTVVPAADVFAVGQLVDVQGTWPLADESAQGFPEPRVEPVYTVRFPAADLWGPPGGHWVQVELWESYLEVVT